ncbi:MAG: tRNA uracil 4-sulfurtransferase ThiI [Lentisphaeria bacterium]|nr:tRNA uracil 4-sulfurtransferase ThiI [Lentisphaeria bacterium]
MDFPKLPYNAILCRYSEIGTKGRNRHVFEKLLAATIRHSLSAITPVTVKREYGRIYVQPAESAVFSGEEMAPVRVKLSRVFGLVSSSPALLVAPTAAAIEAAVDATFPGVYEAVERAHADQPSPIRYAARVRQSNKHFPLRSQELEIRLAERLLPSRPRLVVDLRNPRLRVDVEIREDRAFISYETIPGPGGLPTGTGGKLIAMLSGGIDSPVACHQMMRRGCSLHFVTFHSSPYTPPDSVHKVARLAHVLKDFQGSGLLVSVNLLTAQKAIRDTCEERFRTVLYRRMMVRVCEAVRDEFGCQALVTGDNLGQVASQTLPNMSCINQAARGMILRPLVSMDKNAIVDIARTIGTFDISKEETPDSCTVFAPRSPATNAPLDRILSEETRLDIDGLLKASLRTAVIVNTETLEERPVDWRNLQ